MTSQYRGVVFDLDDTLIDTTATRPYRNRRQWKNAVAEVNRTKIFDGIADLLASLDQRQIPWAIVTTSVSYYAEAVMRHYGLCPTRLVAFHDARPTKPHPKGVLMAVDSLGLPASDVVGVSNARNDLLAYRNAGVLALAASWSLALETDDDWDDIVADPSDLLHFVAPS